jgi:sortase (surface protein transpeptidase)
MAGRAMKSGMLLLAGLLMARCVEMAAPSAGGSELPREVAVQEAAASGESDPESSVAPPIAALVPTVQAVIPTVFVAPALPTAVPVVAPTLAPTPTPDPFLVIGPPVRVRIPSIGVDAPVEMVGLTSDHAMDVPKSWSNVGWYRDGYRPGEPGNAVLAGHLDTSSGGPAVFWSLDDVQPGDEVVVEYGNGDSYTFAVEGQETYQYDAQGPIIDRIFGESLTADLNLVTCDGAWDHGRATYSHRLVVFATLVPEKTVGTGAAGAGRLP